MIAEEYLMKKGTIQPTFKVCAFSPLFLGGARRVVGGSRIGVAPSLSLINKIIVIVIQVKLLRFFNDVPDGIIQRLDHSIVDPFNTVIYLLNLIKIVLWNLKRIVRGSKSKCRGKRDIGPCYLQ